MSNGVFLRENKPVLLQFYWDPTLHHCTDTIKRYKQIVAQNNALQLPPFCLFSFFLIDILGRRFVPQPPPPDNFSGSAPALYTFRTNSHPLYLSKASARKGYPNSDECFGHRQTTQIPDILWLLQWQKWMFIKTEKRRMNKLCNYIIVIISSFFHVSEFSRNTKSLVH